MDKGEKMWSMKMKKEGKYALVLLALLLQEERQCAELQVILGQMMRRKFY